MGYCSTIERNEIFIYILQQAKGNCPDKKQQSFDDSQRQKIE